MSNNPEATARSVRDIFGIDGVPAPDLLQLVVRNIADHIAEWTVEIVSAADVQGDYARTFSERKLLKISRGLVRRLERSDPLARFILAHELGHIALGHREAAAFSALEGGNSYTPEEATEENEANAFALEFLVPRLLIKEGETVGEIAERFCVPGYIAARAQRQALRSSSRSKPRNLASVEAMRQAYQTKRKRSNRDQDGGN